MKDWSSEGCSSDLIEGNERAQIDRARDAALDHVGGLVLVGVDATQKFGRDILPRQTARTVRAERVAAVEFGTHLVEAADDDARRLGGKVRRVVGAREADDGDAGNALEIGRASCRERVCQYV